MLYLLGELPLFLSGLSLVFFLMSFFKPRTLDVQMHDTYYVLDSRFMTRFSAGALLLLAVLYYFLASASLNQTLVVVHIIFTVFPLSFLSLLLLFIHLDFIQKRLKNKHKSFIYFFLVNLMFVILSQIPLVINILLVLFS